MNSSFEISFNYITLSSISSHDFKHMFYAVNSPPGFLDVQGNRPSLAHVPSWLMDAM